jgi:broad specificity phosphatase PhoE
MNKPLVLIKHSLPAIVEGTSAHEWILSDEGRRRAAQLAQRLTPFQPELIVSSPEPKAHETAEIVARAHRLDVTVWEGLHEHERSNVPYLSPDVFEASVRGFFQKPDQVVFGDESADQAHERFAAAVDSVVKWHAGKAVGIVAHGTVISLFVSRLTGIPGFELWKEFGLPSFVVLDLDAKKIITRENNI